MGLFQISDLSVFFFLFFVGFGCFVSRAKGLVVGCFGDASLLVLNYDSGFYLD